MKPQTKSILAVILIVCLIAGCSRTSQVTTQKMMELRNDEPFMATIKEMATKRESFYFLGQPIDKAEYERRQSDINSRRDYGSLVSKPSEHFEGIPIILIRF